METDLIKIENLAKEREDENWTFRTFLKGYDIKNLDTIVHKLFKQVSEAIDCTACGNCCKAIQPSLKKKDFVFRLIGVVNNYSICPIVFNVYEALKNKLKSDFIDFQEEFDEFGY
jgi:hypothetical protein